MTIGVLPKDEIQALHDRLLQLEKERDLLQFLNKEHCQHLQCVAEGKPVAFFWQQVLTACRAIAPDCQGLLLTSAHDQHEWRFACHEDINTSSLRSEDGIVSLPDALVTFSKSPSCPIRKDNQVQHSSEWYLWHNFLKENDYHSVIMANICVPNCTDFLLVMLQKSSYQWDCELLERVLSDRASLIRAAVLREKSDLLLLEEGHYDDKTGALRPYSFEHIFDMFLKDARRHFSRLALISFKLNMTLTSFNEKNLTTLSSVIESTVRDNDLVAYYGEGEFVIGIRINHMTDAEVVARKLLKAVRLPGKAANNLVKEGVKIGVAYYPEHSSFVDLRRAAAHAANSVSADFGYRIEFHDALHSSSSEFYTF